jgi:tRNA-splicing ligase RtcB
MTTLAVPKATVQRDELRAVGDFAFELPRTARPAMRVPIRVYADDALLSAILEGEAMMQLVNVATLPGVVGCAYGMPDMHEGYGFPVGGVAATLLPDGVVSPGGVGFDINCGVRLLSLPLTRAELGDRLESFAARAVALHSRRDRSWRPMAPDRQGA